MTPHSLLSLARRVRLVQFAGGIVIHTAAGVASLVVARHLGPRAGFRGLASEALAAHNLPMAATGAGLLWFGWFGFNGGSALSSGSLASTTLMTTHIAAAAGTIAWMALDWSLGGKPTFVGVINGALSGLAGVTPASGFVAPSAGLVIGLLCGLASYGSVFVCKEVLRIDECCRPGRTGAMSCAAGATRQTHHPSELVVCAQCPRCVVCAWNHRCGGQHAARSLRLDERQPRRP